MSDAGKFEGNTLDGGTMRAEIDSKLLTQVAAEPATANHKELYKALALAAREQLAQRWVKTQIDDRKKKTRRIYYMSMEFLVGRALNNSLSALGLRDAAQAAFGQPGGPSLSDLIECEPDAALGNGGLGRLAACFLDSMATLGIAGMGYGLRYDYGIFRQDIIGGHQQESPDQWLRFGNPWEIVRPERTYAVRFGGRVIEYTGSTGRLVSGK